MPSPSPMLNRRSLLLSLLAPGVLLAQPVTRVVYPEHEVFHDPQLPYILDVLRLALSHGPNAYEVHASGTAMTQGRGLRELEFGRSDINLLWSMTSRAREKTLLTVRIPLDRGILGWRLLLVRADDLERFARIRSLDALRKLQAGQMHDWPDTEILRHNGLPVGTASMYEKLFRMLARSRIDYFPRSVMEIEDELQRYGRPLDLVIAPRLMLRYPTANYFFVSPRFPQLAEDLRLGLEKAIAERSLQALFAQHFRALLQRMDIMHRQVLRLDNPLLPPETPLQRPELWADPSIAF
ncbi:hypothetical protein H5407_19270 [Mitsuaria sp. WAJ17]|uniref:hypothetical protein n=1 Tax=Mitsuaria sp. WAJ17 TaxID=2761452 RepID=UPI0015FFDFB9|nr:hypothetical protein [Mitsuaria sp. WAJ17]MBB2487382.1 hypothetical protein [Mitsuaria sp. WAJ17]